MNENSRCCICYVNKKAPEFYIVLHNSRSKVEINPSTQTMESDLEQEGITVTMTLMIRWLYNIVVYLVEMYSSDNTIP